MVLESIGGPLQRRDWPIPHPAPNELRIRVHACGVCRTDLHIIDGDLTAPTLPLILGHQMVGVIDAIGELADTSLSIGQRVGIPWLGHTCGTCDFCCTQHENLCDDARFTGYHIHGGFAEYAIADPQYCFPLPARYSATQAAPLLCAGLIGYRAYRMAGDAKRIGFYGFGSAAHLLLQAAKFHGRQVYAFTRPGDAESQSFARSLGAAWAGSSTDKPPVQLDAAIIFAPVGALVVAALKATRKAGVVICAGIHMSAIPSFPYRLLWEERTIKSVANLTRRDALEFLALASETSLHATVTAYPLDAANDALSDLRAGRLNGSAVLTLGAPG